MAQQIERDPALPGNFGGRVTDGDAERWQGHGAVGGQSSGVKCERSDEVAETVVFVANSAGNVLTGHNLVVECGTLITDGSQSACHAQNAKPEGSWSGKGKPILALAV